MSATEKNREQQCPAPPVQTTSSSPQTATTKNTEVKKDYSDTIKTIISVAALLLSIIVLLYTSDTNNKTSRRLQETQAYTYWQNFLQLAVKYPHMANGDDSDYYIDSCVNNKENGAAKRVEYAWFVANALGAAEIVYGLQKKDTAWENTLKEVISLHSEYITTEIKAGNFDINHYSAGFRLLIESAIR